MVKSPDQLEERQRLIRVTLVLFFLCPVVTALLFLFDSPNLSLIPFVASPVFGYAAGYRFGENTWSQFNCRVYSFGARFSCLPNGNKRRVSAGDWGERGMKREMASSSRHHYGRTGAMNGSVVSLGSRFGTGPREPVWIPADIYGQVPLI